MSDPLVSVVVPTYERPEKLARAVDSVLKQHYEQWELLVVNDAPDEDVVHILPDDDRITYIRHEENRGAPAARNTGIEASTGEFIALLDDDDAWKPTKLARQLERFDAVGKGCGLVYTGRDIVQDGVVVNSDHPTTEGWIFEDLLAGNVIASETPLIRSECFDRVGGFDTSFESAQDLDMWLRIAREYKIAVVSESLAIAYRGHGDRISEDMDRKYHGLARLLKKYREDFEAHPEVLAHRYKTLGVYAVESGRTREGRRLFVSSLRTYPRDPLVLLYALCTLPPSVVRDRLFKLRAVMFEHGVVSGLSIWLGSDHPTD